MNKLKMMIVGALAVVGAWCAQAGETYLDPVFGADGAVTRYETKTVSNYTTLTGSHGETTLSAGWYVVSGDVKYTKKLWISDDVKIILKDGATLTVDGTTTDTNGGLRIEYDNHLTIYAQSTGNNMGQIKATGSKRGSGIGSGGNANTTVDYPCGYITINGGRITAQGGNFGAGIGGGQSATGRRITINGGIVQATGGDKGAGIGGGEYGPAHDIVINGGEVAAYGGGGEHGGAGIGSGREDVAYDITIRGGTVTAKGGRHAAGIGRTYRNSGDLGGSHMHDAYNITISGGKVTAKGGESAADIGGGHDSGAYNITISGGQVSAEGDGAEKHAAIGGGKDGKGYDITISGGTVVAKNHTEGSVVGAGCKNTDKAWNIRFTGGSIKLEGDMHVLPTCDGSTCVYKLEVPHLNASPETITGLPSYYGVNDLYPDGVDKKLYFYLPVGSYSFTSAAKAYTANVTAAGGTITSEKTCYGVSVSTDGGKNWNDLSTGGGTGAGWKFEETKDLLKLEHGLLDGKAKDYMIKGTNRAGLVRIEVKSKANVTLDNLTMPYTKSDANLITFESGADGSELILKGTSTVYSQNGYAAIDIASGAKVTIKGDGTLVGGLTAGVDSRCVNVEAGGTLVMDAGTISGYTHSGEGGAIHCGGTMTMNGGKICGNSVCGSVTRTGNGAGVTVDGGTLNLLGGEISGNTATRYGGAVYAVDSTVKIAGGTLGDNYAPHAGCMQLEYGSATMTGGVIKGNKGDDGKANGINVGSSASFTVQGGVFGEAPASGQVASGYAATQVGANYIVAQNLEQKDGKLFGGTYTFNPTDKEYKDAGVKLYQYYEAKKQGTDPETYVVQLGETDVKVNGEKITKGSGEGWTFVGATLTLSNAMDYTVTGKSESPFVIDVTAKASVTLKDLKDILNTPGREAIRISADATLTLDGDSTLYTQDGNPAIAVKDGVTLTMDGNGTLTGGKSAGASSRCVEVEAGGTLVMNGGTVSGYRYANDKGGAIYCNGSMTMNGGTISGCDATGSAGGTGIGGAIFNNGSLTIFGGAINDCSATRYGGAIANGSGHYTYIYGGTFKGNSAPTNPFLDSYDSEVTGYLYGGVWVGNDYDPSKDPEVSRKGGTAVTKVGDNYLVAKGLEQRDGKLTGGTYTFDPTDKEYKDAGVKVETGYVVTAQGGSPATYEVGMPPTGFTVNGIDICKKKSVEDWGWTYDDVTGLLTLDRSGHEFTLTGDGSAMGLGVLVDHAGITVVLSNATLAASNHAPLTVNAEYTDVELIGENTLTALGETAAIAVPSGASVKIYVADGYATTNTQLTAVGGEGYLAIGGEGDVAIKGGTIVAQGGINGAKVTISGGIITAVGGEGVSGIGDADANVTIDGGTIVAQGNGVADIDGNVVISGGSVQANFVTNPKDEEDGEAVFRVTVPDVTQEGPLKVDGISYGQTDLYPIDNALYLWLPNEYYEFYIGEDEENLYYATVCDESTVAYRAKFDIYVNGEQVTEAGGTGWSYNWDESHLTLLPSAETTNSYVITGASTDGDVVSIIVEGSCDVTADGLQLGSNDGSSLYENLLQIGNGDDECTVNLTITGASAFIVGERGDVAPLGVMAHATLNFCSPATIQKWDINVDEENGARVTAEDPTALTFTSEDDAGAAAGVIQPWANTEDFPGINQVEYAAMFTVSYVAGAVEGTWTLRYSPTEDTEMEIEESFPAAETELANNLANDNPTTTIDGVEGFYYGLASATSEAELADAEPTTWYASQGGNTTVSGAIFPGCGKVYYQIRATRLPGETEVAGDNTVATTDTGVTVGGADVAQGTGVGWKYDAVGKVLTLMDSQAYVLSGGNTAGKVRVEVTAAEATVTLKDLSLIAETPAADLITFSSGATNATLTLVGVNTVYAANELAAINVATGATLTVSGEGELVGGKAGSHLGRGAYVAGTLNWNGGTLRDYYNQKDGQEKGAGIYVTSGGIVNLSGGTISGTLGCDGGAFYNMGTVNMTGGVVSNNCAVFGSAFYCGTGAHVNLYGGVVTGNGATGATGYLCTGTGTITAYGGVVSGNTGKSLTYKCTFNLYGAVGADVTNAVPKSGYAVVQVGDTYVVGQNVTVADGKLRGGTYTFCPTNAEYVAAELSVAPGTLVTQMATDPVTWVLGEALVPTVTVDPAAEEHAKTVGVYTNSTVEVSGPPYVVYTNAAVTVTYTADAGYEFAGGKTTWSTNFTANAATVTVTIPASEKPVVASTGVTVGGVDVCAGAGEGWTFADGVLSLTNSQSYVIAGGNTKGKVRVEVTATNATVRFDNLTLNGLGTADAAVKVLSGAGLTLPGDGKLTGKNLLLVANGGTAKVLGGVFEGSTPFSAEEGGSLTVYGCVSHTEIKKCIASGYKCEGLTPSECADLYVVGKDVEQDGDDLPQLTKGTYTFCPTNAEYVAAYEGNLLVKPGTPVTQMKTTPVTWVLGEVIVYPDYLAGYGYAVTNTFTKWAKAYPPGDPDGIYKNAFLLNVAQNREQEAVAAFKIGSIAVTNEVVDAVTNTLVYVEVAKPLKPAVMFNGITWLQCATNALDEAEWLDIETGRYTEEGQSFFIQRIDFEHKLTPEAFPTEAEGTKTMRVKLVE